MTRGEEGIAQGWHALTVVEVKRTEFYKKKILWGKKNKIKVSLKKNMTILCRRNQSIITKSVIPLMYSATSVNVVKLPYPNTRIGHK